MWAGVWIKDFEKKLYNGNVSKKERSEIIKHPKNIKRRCKDNLAKAGRIRLGLWVAVVLIGAVAALASMGVLWVLTPKFRYFGFAWERKIEYGEEFAVDNGEVCFGTFISCEPLEMNASGEVNTGELGDYKVVYVARYEDREVVRETVVKVVDEMPPELELTELEGADGEEKRISVCPNGKIPPIELKANDNHDGDLTDRIQMEYDGKELVRISVLDESGNKTEKIVKGVVEDRIAPTIVLNGAEVKTIARGTVYDDEGAMAKDNCDEEVSVEMEGSVNVGTDGEYILRYVAKDEVGNETEKVRTINVVNPEDGNKIIYLTFDDGPGEYTGRLLDILAKYGVKVTFFVTGRGDDSLIKREYDEGHTVALHTNSHDYAYIYSSVDNYFTDLYAVRDRVKRITGYVPTLMRFPGGSSNTISAWYSKRIMSVLVGEVERRGFQYADWNLSSGDAGGASTADQVYDNVVSRLGDGRYIVLQHDVKGFSVDAVERIIQYGQANGYIFLPLTNDSPFLAHHGVNN